jgi:ATP-dependent protease Clp ATPase subunit
MERLLEPLMFELPNMRNVETVIIDKQFVLGKKNAQLVKEKKRNAV